MNDDRHEHDDEPSTRPLPPDELDRMLARYFAPGSASPNSQSRAGDPATEREADALLAALDPTAFERRYADFTEIGRGGMGQVLSAWDRQLNREVALKILPGPWAAEPSRLRQFLREARTCARLQHPGIVPIYDVGVVADGRPYLAMKLVHGRELAAVLREAQGDEAHGDEARRQVLTMFGSIAQALAYAHSRGVAHCDLKPSNVMVGRFGEVLVMDWGLARGFAMAPAANAEGSVVANATPSSAIGTIPYSAPEQARGEIDKFDARTDVFALGALLCEILTGLPPYPGSEGDALAKARAGDLARAHERLAAAAADPVLVELARRCLSPAQDDRPQSAGEVAEAVEAYLASLAERARRAEVRAAEAKVRSRWTLALAATMLLAGTIGGLAWQWYRSDRDARVAKAEGTVRAALQEAVVLRAQAEASPGLDVTAWRRAVAIAENAEAVAQAQGAGDALTGDVRALLTEVRARAARKELDATTRGRLNALRLSMNGTLERARQDMESRYFAGCAEVFRDYGVDVLTMEPAVAAAALRGEIAADIAEALNLWSLFVAVDSVDRAAHIDAVLEQLDPDPWRGSLRRVQRSAKLLQGGRVQAGPEVAERLLQLLREVDLATQPPVVLTWPLEMLLRLGRQQDAIAWSHRCRVAHPQAFELAFQLATAVAQVEPPRAAEAIAYTRLALALRPEDTEALHQLGILLARQGDLEPARAAFEELCARQPERAHWHAHLAEILAALARQTGDPRLLTAASEHAARAVATDPMASDHSMRSFVQRQQRDFEGALASLRAALAKEPSDSYRMQIASVFAEMGDRVGQEGALREALAANARNFDALVRLAGLLLAQRRLDEAIECYGQAIAVRPDAAAVEANLAVAMSWQGNEPEALRHYRRASEIEPASAVWRIELAKTLRRSGEDEEAMQQIELALALDPRSTEAHLQHGTLLAERHFAFDRALLALERAHELDGANALACQSLASVLKNLGRLPEALDMQREAVRLDPEDPGQQAELFQLMFDTGRTDEAAAQLAQMREHFAGRIDGGLGEWLGRSDHLLANAARWEAVCAGTAAASDAADWNAAAELAYKRGQFLAAASTWARLFAAHPEFAAGAAGSHRYNAACCALRGATEPTLSDAERADWRQRALGWLEVELALLRGDPQSGAALPAEVLGFLRHWLRDPDLATVRDPAAIAALPADEAAGWRGLWQAVAAALDRGEPAAAEAGARR